MQKICVIISFDDLVFDDAEQEVVVFIGEKNSTTKECNIANCSFKNLDDLINNFSLEKLDYNH